MNSEELELSLRAEFESYLKGVLVGVRQDISDFQKNFEAEFAKHKAQMDEAFRDLSTRFESDLTFDAAFTESVMEHLRLARDEGAQITANAFGEAEKLRDESAPAANYNVLRDAINDISSQTSQSAILKSLVEHAGNFTPRGAFFIVKNDHFVGWKVLGREGKVDESTVREIHFPISSNTILADSINALATRESSYGKYEDDPVYLERLEFGRPDRMYAIPLTARGRGVAILYADYGTEGIQVNKEALETLVRVAGVTVELLAASQAAKLQPVVSPTVASEAERSEVQDSTKFESATAEEVHSDDAPQQNAQHSVETPEIEEVEEFAGEVEIQEISEHGSFDSEADAEGAFSEHASDDPQGEGEEVEEEAYFEPVPDQETVTFAEHVEDPAPAIEADFSFAPAVQVPHHEPAGDYAFAPPEAVSTNGHSFNPAPEPAVEIAPVQTVRSRLNDRNVDLPIEVDEDERRDHNAARRFARLLVSEIKLYNEQKVNEGREMSDLYDRLREAIERSREMYDKRVQPPVAAKFDYFHYELVNGLADGDDAKLGKSYPGAAV